MKLIKLKKLPTFSYTSPMSSLSERLAIIWAEGRGVKELYWVIPMQKWIVKVDK